MRKFLVTLVLFALAGCSKLTLQHYEQIKVGLTQQEVEALIGGPASCDETLGVRVCNWGDEKRSVTVSFVAGKVVLFSAHNIK